MMAEFYCVYRACKMAKEGNIEKYQKLKEGQEERRKLSLYL